MMMQNNPFGNFNNMMNRLNQFRQNPVQYMMQSRLNIPQNLQGSSPQEIQQYLLNSGQINQNQMNWAQNMARQIQNNPMFSQFMNGQK